MFSITISQQTSEKRSGKPASISTAVQFEPEHLEVVNFLTFIAEVMYMQY